MGYAKEMTRTVVTAGREPIVSRHSEMSGEQQLRECLEEESLLILGCLWTGSRDIVWQVVEKDG